MRLVKIIFMLLGCLVILQGSKSDVMDGTQMTGTISAIDIGERLVTIGQVQYSLSDKLRITDKNNFGSSEAILEAGQQIDFWVSYSGTIPTIKKIRVLSDIHLRPS